MNEQNSGSGSQEIKNDLEYEDILKIVLDIADQQKVLFQSLNFVFEILSGQKEQIEIFNKFIFDTNEIIKLLSQRVFPPPNEKLGFPRALKQIIIK